jgi:hypothetical protein
MEGNVYTVRRRKGDSRMNTAKTWRDKSVGEMTGAEFDVACFAAIGLRPPKDPGQQPAYIVTSVFVTASQTFSDQDLIETYVVNFLLGRGDQLPEFRPLLEKALGRAIDVNEPKPFDLEALLQVQAERRRAAFE